MAATAGSTERRDALVERLFMDAIGAFDLLSVYLGDVLGLYRALADEGPLTSAELAEAAGIHERYAREWLEHQAASGLLELESNGDARRYRLPKGHDEALLDSSSLSYIAPLARSFAGAVKPLEELVAAFRTGEGVAYADYGDDLHEGQAAFTKPLFENLLAKEWLPGAPEIHERLLANPPARVADVACGQGRSSIEIARGYQKVQVDGIDSDRASIARAREHLAGSGVEDRVTFHERNAADAGLAGRYDLVTIFEALHDMSYPVEVLTAARNLLADGGVVFIGDERTEEEFTAPASEVERLYYGFSVFHCLPVGMVGENAAGTGTVMRAETVRCYADEAGLRQLRGATDRARLLAVLFAPAVTASVALTLRARESVRTAPRDAPGQAGPARAQGDVAECHGSLSKDRAWARLRLRVGRAIRAPCTQATRQRGFGRTRDGGSSKG